MADDRPLSYENHRIYVPAFHFALSAILVLNFLYRGYRLITNPGVGNGMDLLLAVAFFLFFWYIRIFPLRAQDRTIRLEMMLRLKEVLPEDLQGRIHELRRGQIVGLRFAGDEELPELVRDALENKTSGEALKRKIKDWQPDTWRF